MIAHSNDEIIIKTRNEELVKTRKSSGLPGCTFSHRINGHGKTRISQTASLPQASSSSTSSSLCLNSLTNEGQTSHNHVTTHHMNSQGEDTLSKSTFQSTPHLDEESSVAEALFERFSDDSNDIASSGQAAGATNYFDLLSSQSSQLASQRSDSSETTLTASESHSQSQTVPASQDSVKYEPGEVDSQSFYKNYQKQPDLWKKKSSIVTPSQESNTEVSILEDARKRMEQVADEQGEVINSRTFVCDDVDVMMDSDDSSASQQWMIALGDHKNGFDCENRASTPLVMAISADDCAHDNANNNPSIPVGSLEDLKKQYEINEKPTSDPTKNCVAQIDIKVEAKEEKQPKKRGRKPLVLTPEQLAQRAMNKRKKNCEAARKMREKQLAMLEQAEADCVRLNKDVARKRITVMELKASVDMFKAKLNVLKSKGIDISFVPDLSKMDKTMADKLEKNMKAKGRSKKR